MFSSRKGHQLKTCVVLIGLEENFPLADILINREAIHLYSGVIAPTAHILLLCSFANVFRSASQACLQLIDVSFDLYPDSLHLKMKIPALCLLKGFSLPEAFG